MEEAVIREDVVPEVMVFIKTVGVTVKLGLLQCNMVESMGRQVIEPIVMLSLEDLKHKHLMLSSQVSFWFAIA